MVVFNHWTIDDIISNRKFNENSHLSKALQFYSLICHGISNMVLFDMVDVIQQLRLTHVELNKCLAAIQ